MIGDDKKERFERAKKEFKVGDIYLDVFYHPTLCTQITIEEDDVCLEGISLYDGTYPRGCSVMHSGPEKISVERAWKMKLKYQKKQAEGCHENISKEKDR